MVLDDPAPVLADLRIDQFAQMRLEAFVCAFLIRAHQARIADHIRGEDRGETAVAVVVVMARAALTSTANLTYFEAPATMSIHEEYHRP